MIYCGDLFDVLPTLDAESIDSCVTDPPYGIGFMSKKWDTFKPENLSAATRKLMHPREREAAKLVSDNPNINGRHRSPALSPSQIDYDYSTAGLRGFQEWTERWGREVFRVMKPGAYIVVCGAPRSYHRMACGLEDAGFIIRDKFSFLFGSGFPKSLNFGCKCRGNALQYNHAPGNNPVRGVRQGSDDAAGVVAAHEAPDLLAPLQRDSSQQGAGEALAQGPGSVDAGERGVLPREDVGREQPGVEGRELHRAGEGLPDDPDAGASPRAGKRVRAGTSGRGGADTRPAAEAGRGSASQGSGPGEQRPGKSASLRLPSRTLDSGASDRSSRCERCGGLTSARGLGTALKPAHEPIALAWKPFKGTITDTYIKHGTAALNIDACRIDSAGLRDFKDSMDTDLGRWPANVLLDDVAAAALDEQTGVLVSGANPTRRGSDKFRDTYGEFKGQTECDAARGLDVGGASRFYKIAAVDCVLCGLSCVERDTMSGCETTSADTAARRSRTIRRIIDATALNPAHVSLAERLVQAAPSVESLCETCVTSIVLALVEVKCSGSTSAASTVFRASTPSYKSSILIQNLASFAALWGNIDTIPTTASLSLLFGSVCHAIGSCTRQASHESASDQQRFLYSAKPSREERDFGCHGLTASTGGEATDRKEGSAGLNNPRAGAGRTGGARNIHPTVKPVELMRWLVKLVTPPGGVVLDPFMGSGTTGMACRYESRQFIGIEREADYIQIAERRIAAVAPLFGEATAS